MREVKFRGQTNEKEWVYGYYFFNGTQHGIIDNVHFAGSWTPIAPETLGQFVNVKGYEGYNFEVELYEGDLVSITTDKKTPYKIVFDGVNFYGLANDGDDWGPFTLNLDFYKNQGRVKLIRLGNIHDNPELYSE